ncbi:MAG: rhodanese-like domain-containing protein [Chloroflexi bacterium AL-W]|nr:rhodanese-like domain-containing protein [Chloroflexi bacterium AL-W]
MNILKTLFGGDTSAVSPADAKALLEGENPPFVLDVRQPEEFKTGHIKGAKLIPLNDLSGRMNELPKDRKILCVCRSGARSSIAIRQLTQAGFHVVNMQGGMMGWQGANLPVKKGK